MAPSQEFALREMKCYEMCSGRSETIVPTQTLQLPGPLSIGHSPGNTWNSDGMTLTGERRRLGEKPVLMPISQPQIPHGLPWARTPTAGVRS